MHRLLAFLLVTGLAVAQDAPKTAKAHLGEAPKVSTQVTERLVPASHSDLYCAGFLAKEPARKDTFVVGGLHSPNQTRFHTSDLLYINGDYAIGSRVSFVRQTADQDRTEAFKGQHAALRTAGDLMADLGYAVVVEKRGDATVVQVEFSCDAIVPGDFVVPFVARPEVEYRKHSTFDRLPVEVKSIGRIIAAREFDQYVASGQKVYFDIGAQKGLKPGDMVLVVRNYSTAEMDRTDMYESKTRDFETSRKNTPKLSADGANKMPERVVAEAVVLGVQNNSATAMITFALSEVHVGDRIAAEPAEMSQSKGGAQ